LLKISDLSRKGGLSNAQVHRGFGHGPQFGDGNEGSEAPQIHAKNICRRGMEYQHNYALDGSRPGGAILTLEHQLSGNVASV
jgi:hypothetical protein